MVTETFFENRYMHVPELSRMGANITVQRRFCTYSWRAETSWSEVMATDLRASLSLVIAALAAEGESLIHRVYHLDRGYERLEEKTWRVVVPISNALSSANRKKSRRHNDTFRIGYCCAQGRILNELRTIAKKVGLFRRNSFFDDDERQLQFACENSDISLIAYAVSMSPPSSLSVLRN